MDITTFSHFQVDDMLEMQKWTSTCEANPAGEKQKIAH